MTDEMKTKVLAALRRAIALVEADREEPNSLMYFAGGCEFVEALEGEPDAARVSAEDILDQARDQSKADCEWPQDVERIGWGVMVVVECATTEICRDPYFADYVLAAPEDVP